MRNTRFCLTIALLLSAVCGAGVASYDLGQPVPLDTRPITPYYTGWFQSNPAIAGSDSGYLAVWVDMRDAGRGSDLYAARIAANGTVLDPMGIRLTTNASVSGKPDVCWNGQSFFIVYADNSGTVGTQIKGLRVSPDGAVLDAGPILVVDAGDTIQMRDPHVAWNGTYHVVAWIADWDGVHIENDPIYGGVYTRTVSLGGAVTPMIRTTFAGGLTSDQGATGVSVACSLAGATLIVWSDDRNAATTSTDLYGSVQGEGGQFVICTDASIQEQPECCWTGSQFLVVWTDSDSSYRSIRGKRISATGTVLDPSPLIISFVTQKQSDPEVVWNGTNALVTWARRNQDTAKSDIYANRVWEDGTIVDGSGFAVCAQPDGQIRPCVASVGGSYIVCWMDSYGATGPTVPNFGYQVRAGLVTSGGMRAGNDFPITQSAAQHKITCSAYNGRQFLVCWDEWRNGQRNLYCELIDAYTGAPVTSSPIIVDPLAVENPHPTAVWNGNSFVLAWLGGDEVSPGRIAPTKIVAARIGSDGDVIEGGIGVYDTFNGTTSTPMYIEPAIASAGNGTCRVVFRVGASIHMVSMFPDGPSSTNCTDAVIATSKSNAVYESPAVCWTGERYVVAWKQALSTSPTLVKGGIDYLTVTADGTLSPLQRITDETYPDYFKLACNGQNVMLAAYGPQIRMRRLSLTGGLIDTVARLIPDSVGADAVGLTWNGSNYVLTWMAGRSVNTSAPGWQDDMLAIRISSDNVLVDPSPIAITNSPITEIGGSVCAGPMGRVFLAYAGYEGTPYGSTRAKGMYLNESLNLTSLGQLRNLYEGAQVSLSGATGPVVSAIFMDRFYVQDARNFGIAVWADPASIATGDAMALTGRLTNLNGEAVINVLSPQVLSHGNAVPNPVGMTIRDLGGIGSSPVFSTVDNALGLYNIGLLVKVFGRVVSARDGCFYIDDGSKVDSPEFRGVKVVTSGTDLPALDSMVQVTGVSSSYQFAGQTYRLIRAVGWSVVPDDAPPPIPL